MTHAQKRTYRLWPGMYCESPTPGIGVGAPQFGQRRGLYGGLNLAF